MGKWVQSLLGRRRSMSTVGGAMPQKNSRDVSPEGFERLPDTARHVTFEMRR
jgi:hypothetical protein